MDFAPKIAAPQKPKKIKEIKDGNLKAKLSQVTQMKALNTTTENFRVKWISMKK